MGMDKQSIKQFLTPNFASKELSLKFKTNNCKVIPALGYFRY